MGSLHGRREECSCLTVGEISINPTFGCHKQAVASTGRRGLSIRCHVAVISICILSVEMITGTLDLRTHSSRRLMPGLSFANATPALPSDVELAVLNLTAVTSEIPGVQDP